MTRARLPNRRPCLNFEFLAGERGQEKTLHAGVGFYPDGRPGEVFITGTKVANGQQIVANEAAIAISFALQHEADLQAMREAMPREEDGRPQGLMGALLDALVAKLAEIRLPPSDPEPEMPAAALSDPLPAGAAP